MKEDFIYKKLSYEKIFTKTISKSSLYILLRQFKNRYIYISINIILYRTTLTVCLYIIK